MGRQVEGVADWWTLPPPETGRCWAHAPHTRLLSRREDCDSIVHQCGLDAETRVGLCRHHYREIVGEEREV